MAIQFGMPLKEFWHDDLRLFECYQKAYYRNISYSAWLNGAHFYEGVSKAIYNGFGRKSSCSKVETYSSWVDPIEKMPKKKEKNFDQELQYRKQQADQNMWLGNMLRK